MLARNDREHVDGFVLSLRWDETLAQALAANESGTVADVFGQPLFDDFGEVIGGLVGYRVLRPHEPTLTAFASLSGRDVLILSDQSLLSSAGSEVSNARLGNASAAQLHAVLGAEKVARCIPQALDIRLCVAAPLRELQRSPARSSASARRARARSCGRSASSRG
ncbi:hypothetical protein ACU4GA_18315 [Methylobacterium oryzae CBMB20]